jgi:hypothetical protein
MPRIEALAGCRWREANCTLQLFSISYFPTTLRRHRGRIRCGKERSDEVYKTGVVATLRGECPAAEVATP